MMDDPLQQITEWKEKAVRYENMREKYVSHAEKIKEVIVQLQLLLSEIDPFVNVMKPRGHYGKNSDKLEELYKILQAGTNVSVDFIRATYSGMSMNDCRYLWVRLRKMSNVSEGHNKNKKFLFARKDA